MAELKKSYYAIIPANIRYDDELTPNAKLLYGEITALCNEKGYCWANNEYFAKLYGVSKVSVSNWINQLVDRGYLASEMIYKEGSKEIKNRYLRIGDPIKENFNTPQRNLYDPIKENFNTPIKENFKDNNTLLNNTSNNTLDISTTSSTCSSKTTTNKKNTDLIIDKWNELGLQQLRSINNNTNRYKLLNARIKEYGLTDVVQAIDNVKKSSFLQGQNKKGWTITFDWLVRPNNFLKVLEGNYTDKGDKVGKNNRTITEQHGKYNESEYDRLVRLAEERGAKPPKDDEIPF